MDVKKVVQLAVNHIRDLFEHDELSNLGLEEVEFDADLNQWVVTVGFSRPWDYPQNTLATLTAGGGRPSRSFKIVRVNGNTGEIIAIKNHPADE